MSEFEPIASEVVAIHPSDPKQFRAELIAMLEKAIGSKPFVVPVVPELGAFRKSLQAQLSEKPFAVPVVPFLSQENLAKFRAQLARELTIPISVTQVTPTGATGTRGVGPTNPSEGVNQAEQERAKQLTRLEAAQASVITSQRQLDAATEEGISAELRAQRVSAARAGTAQAIKRALELEAKATLDNNTALAEQAAAEVGNLRVIEEKISALSASTAATRAATEANAAAAAALQTQTTVEEENLAIRSSLAAVDEAGALKTTQLASARAELAAANRVASAAEKNLQAAEATGVEEVIALAVETERLAKARVGQATSAVEAAIAENELAAAAARTAAAESAATRGAGAQLATLAGLRGATLAASGEFLAGTVAAIAFTKAIKAAASLQTQLNVFQATAGATADQLKAVRKEAISLGNDITLPGVGANDAAQAMTELAKAGLDVQNSIDGARGVLELATAAEISNAQATQLVADALNAFGLSGNDAVRVADLLANASVDAQGSIADMGGALSQVASVSRLTGISIESTVALITLLAKNGIAGSEAGTTLRVALLRLFNPSKDAAEILKKLNIQVLDLQGNVRPDVFAQLANATNNLTAAERNRDLAIIFGTRAIRAQAILGREGAQALAQETVAVQKAGTAQELAHAQTEGFAGSVEALRNAMETLGINLGTLTLGPLTDFAKGLSDVLETAQAIVDLAKEAPGELNKFFRIDIPGIDNTTGKLFKLLTFSVGGPQIGIAKSISFIRREVEGLGNDSVDAAGKVAKILKAFETGSGAGGSVALNQAIIQLQDLIDELNKGGPAAQQLARDVQKVLDQLKQPAKAPFRFPEIKLPVSLEPKPDIPTQVDHLIRTPRGEIHIPVKIDIDTSDIAPKGKKTGDAFIDSLSPELTGQPLFAVTQQFESQLGSQTEAGASHAGDRAGKAFVTSLSTQLALAQAAGNQAAQLTILFQQLAVAERHQAQQERTKNRPGGDKALANAANRVTDIKAQIKAIQSDQAAQAQSAADAITKARNAHDQKILDAITGREAILQNQISAAGLTPALRDDIKRNIALKNFLRAIIKNRIDTIKDAKTRAQALAQAKSDLISVRSTLKDLRDQEKQLVEDQKDKRQQILDLNVQIAEANNNKRAEAAALRVEIDFLNSRIKSLQSQKHKTQDEIIAIKQLQLTLAQKKAALKDLKKEQQGVQDAQKALFDVLTTSQGFATNLLGNLIGLPLSGLVGLPPAGGGGSEITGVSGGSGGGLIPSVRDSGDAVAARQRLGIPNQPVMPSPSPADALSKANQVSRAQGDTLIHLQRQTLRVLLEIARGLGHPEAQRHRRKARANITVHGD